MASVRRPTLCATARPHLGVLIDALREEAGAIALDLVASDEEAAWRLREGQCAAALLTPLACAGQPEGIVLLPDAAVCANGPTGDLVLTFRPDLRSIASVAAVGCDAADRILAALLLREKYGMTPLLTELPQAPGEDDARFDAVLAPRVPAPGGPAPGIDVIDEWFDMTVHPYVRAVTAAWETEVTPAFAAAVSSAAGRADAAMLRAAAGRMDGRLSEDDRQLVPGHYRCALDPAALEAIDAWFHLAFLHGLHRDVPVFRVWAPSDPAACA